MKTKYQKPQVAQIYHFWYFDKEIIFQICIIYFWSRGPHTNIRKSQNIECVFLKIMFSHSMNQYNSLDDRQRYAI